MVASDVCTDGSKLEDNITNASNEHLLETKGTTGNSYYSSLSLLSTNRPESGINDGSALVNSNTPSHPVKQSDNPLYSSTQELRMCASPYYDTVPSRSSSHNVHSNNISMPFDADSDNNYKLQSLNSTKIINNHLSYGLELQVSGRKIPPLCHQRSLSQGVDPIYTEL